MTHLADLPTLSRLIRRIGLPRFIGELAEALHADFLRWPQFQKQARVVNHSPGGVIELMPASDGSRYAFKYVNGHPGNPARGLSTVVAFGVLADVQTGYPLLLSEMTLSTALRTAAVSLLAAWAMARPGARRMAMVGNGAQAEFQALAFHCHLGIDEIHLFDVDPQATARLMRNLAPYPALRLVGCESVVQAVRGADIVSTLTADKRRATILTPDMIEPGMHLNAVGGDCPDKTELHAGILQGARVVVEYEPQTRIEGEIQQMPADFPVLELWRVLAGEAPGRESSTQVTLFDSVGFALEDFSTLRYLHDQLQLHGLGRDIALVPQLADPKDLFSLTRAEVPLPSYTGATDDAAAALAAPDAATAAAGDRGHGARRKPAAGALC
ncbi:ornithine cyclodeaminase [Variovorax sp. OV329]|uniref:ornithine cyclodeaminase n=1 Tax=Variovorax sp. OV329 TaxID=1882825 RepID=UPI0008EC16C2|nr:ornithine cyclodeaminase [Variovorax sp. OV329]SFN10439.1 ornithine cyclodeaminase [Variovorax sp. OV329]